MHKTALCCRQQFLWLEIHHMRNGRVQVRQLPSYIIELIILFRRKYRSSNHLQFDEKFKKKMSSSYVSDINAGWNWIASGGSSVAAKTTHRAPRWVIPPKNSFQKPKDCVAFDSKIKGHVPGYTGYVKGADRLAGYSYGVCSKIAMQSTDDEIECMPQIPDNLHSTIKEDITDKTSVASMQEAPPKRIPGYMGFVAQSRDQFGDTFGRTTAKCLKESYEYNGYRSFEDQTAARHASASGINIVDGQFVDNKLVLARQ